MGTRDLSRAVGQVGVRDHRGVLTFKAGLEARKKIMTADTGHPIREAF